MEVNWQKIETAPKDGTSILGARFVAYLGGGEVFPMGCTMMWEGSRILKNHGWAYTGHCVCMVAEEDQPTHWLALPPCSSPPRPHAKPE